MVKCAHCNIQVIEGEFCPECGVRCSATEKEEPEPEVDALASGYELAGRYVIEQVLETGAVTLYRASSGDQKVLVKERRKNSIDQRVGAVAGQPVQEVPVAGLGPFTLPLEAEAQLLKSLESEAFQRVYDHFVEGEKEYLVLECLSGERLSETISTRKLNEHVAIGAVIQLCEAVSELHGKCFAHLDIDPSNIVLYDNRLKLLLTGRGRSLGTYDEYLTTDGYSAPELYRGTVDVRADIYSIGAVFYTLLTNKVYTPERGPSEILLNVRDSEIARILITCLATNPESRYQTADELKQILLAYQAKLESNLQFDTCILSDVGIVRKNNEDCGLVLDFKVWRESQVESSGLYIVADGMGGEQAGEVASSKAIDEILRAIWDSLITRSKTESNELVKMAIEKANKEIYRLARANPALSSMGTTVTLGLRIGRELYIGHVGDSRAYLIRGGEIIQLTEDHSLVAGLVKAGMITADQAKTHPDRGKIFRSLGNAPDVFVDNLKEQKLVLQAGNALIFCTDGLVDHVADEELLAVVSRSTTAYEACSQLIALANQRGGDDNVTIIIMKTSV